MSTTSTPAEHAVIKTSYGEMTVALWSDVAPKTVENFKKLAREGFYNGTAFHRIIKGFMIQGGCPNTREGATGIPGTGHAPRTGIQSRARKDGLPMVNRRAC